MNEVSLDQPRNRLVIEHSLVPGQVVQDGTKRQRPLLLEILLAPQIEVSRFLAPRLGGHVDYSNME